MPLDALEAVSAIPGGDLAIKKRQKCAERVVRPFLANHATSKATDCMRFVGFLTHYPEETKRAEWSGNGRHAENGESHIRP